MDGRSNGSSPRTSARRWASIHCGSACPSRLRGGSRRWSSSPCRPVRPPMHRRRRPEDYYAALAVPPGIAPLGELANHPAFPRAVVPAAGGVANARSLARLYASLIGDGVDGQRLLVAASGSRPRRHSRPMPRTSSSGPRGPRRWDISWAVSRRSRLLSARRRSATPAPVASRPTPTRSTTSHSPCARPTCSPRSTPSLTPRGGSSASCHALFAG